MHCAYAYTFTHTYIPSCYKVLLHFDIFFFKVSKITIYWNKKTNRAFHIFSRIIKILFFNVTSFRNSDTAQTMAETLANVANLIFSH